MLAGAYQEFSTSAKEDLASKAWDHGVVKVQEGLWHTRKVECFWGAIIG
jgi:hypothetical protein